MFRFTGEQNTQDRIVTGRDERAVFRGTVCCCTADPDNSLPRGRSYRKFLSIPISIQGIVEVNLWNTQITDAGLVHLEGLTSLRTLHLYNTQITDAGLVHLQGLTSLQDLNLSDTKITDAGVAKLKEALPNCEISR